MSRGNALVEVLVVGVLVVLMVVGVGATAMRLHSAGETMTEVAQTAALFAARHGDASTALEVVYRLAPDSMVEIETGDDEITVIVRKRVGVLGPAGTWVTKTVTGRATAALSPLRSGRG